MRQFRVWFLFSVLGLISVPLAAQNFKPFTSLQVLSTEHFDIIFPEASRQTAITLSQFADADFERVTAYLDLHPTARIPVTITPDTDEFNGYATFLPYTHIVLFDTPLSLQWVAFDNHLEKLFIHELTHAISTATRTPFWDVVHTVFGGWVAPALLTTPPFFVEGVAVSVESLDGSGRSNDPLVKERVRQALRDNVFFTPFQATGTYDDFHAANAAYEYGGLFSSWLQKSAGRELYAQLWQAMGSPGPLGLDFGSQGFFGIFQSVYGRPLSAFWADFADSLALRGLELNPADPLVAAPTRLTTLASGGGTTVGLNAVTGRVEVWTDGVGKPPRQLVPAESVRDLDVSADGSTILVSGFRYAGDLAEAVVQEYSAASLASTGRMWKGLWSARYFRDGVVGLGARVHNNRIVWRSAAGDETVFLEGDETHQYSAPAPLGNRLLLLVTEGGRRQLVSYNVDTGKTERLTSVLADDALRWAWARDLRTSGGKTWFIWDSDDRTYRPGYLREEDGQLVAAFADQEFSGGVHTPVVDHGQLVYRATYSATDSLLTYPGSFAEVPVRSAPWAAPASVVAIQPGPETRPYWGAAWFNPLLLWYPTLLNPSLSDLTVEGAGLATYLSDPTDTDVVTLEAGWNWVRKAPTAALLWTSKGLGFPVVTTLDTRPGATDSVGTAVQIDRANVRAAWSTGLGGEAVSLHLTPLAALLWAEPVGLLWGLSAGAIVSTVRQQPKDLFDRGESLTLGSSLASDTLGPNVSVSVRSGYPWGLPVRAGAYAFFDPNGSSVDGYSPLFGASEFGELAPQYAALALDVWGAGGSLEWQALTVEAQTNVSLLYVHRLFATAGWNAGANSGGLAQSWYGRLGAVITLSIGAMADVTLIPHLIYTYTSQGTRNLTYDLNVSW